MEKTSPNMHRQPRGWSLSSICHTTDLRVGGIFFSVHQINMLYYKHIRKHYNTLLRLIIVKKEPQ